MNRSFRAPERGKIGNLRMRDNRDEDLELFREMRKLEKERSDLMFHNSDEFDAPLGQKTGSFPIFSIPSAPAGTMRKTGADDFLNSENDKNDYDWLITPPGTPLFSPLEMESHKTVMSQLGTPKARPTALRSRLANPQPEPVPRPGSNTSTGALYRPSSSGSRPVTPTGRPIISSKPKSNLTSPSSKPTSTISSKLTSKPTRSSTPTRPNLPSKPTIPPRSSTISRSSTPTNRPSIPPPKSSNSRASTPTRGPTAPPRSNSPTLKPRPWKPNEMPGFTLDAPPNLRTSISDRPPSATRGRPPGGANSRSSSVEPNPRVRRQSSSPSRGRLPNNGVVHHHMSGSSVPVAGMNRLQAKANDHISPGLMGSKMVERAMNMRKLVPPKQEGKGSPRGDLSGKASSPDSSGFGRNLSKKSIDMAIRHMDLRRTIPGNLRPLMTNIPASSMYSVRSGSGSGPTRSRTISVSDSPLATSSNTSSEVSVNNALWREVIEIDDDVNRSICRSPSSLRGR